MHYRNYRGCKTQCRHRVYVWWVAIISSILSLVQSVRATQLYARQWFTVYSKCNYFHVIAGRLQVKYVYQRIVVTALGIVKHAQTVSGIRAGDSQSIVVTVDDKQYSEHNSFSFHSTRCRRSTVYAKAFSVHVFPRIS